MHPRAILRSTWIKFVLARQTGPRSSRTSSNQARGDRSLVVALVTDAIYPYHRGGKETRTRHLAEGLAARGIEVHVFTMQWWKGSAYRQEASVHYHGLCRPYPLYAGDRRSIFQAVMFALACLRLVWYPYDVIEADHMPHLQLFTIRVVAWIRRVPLVSTWHEYWGFDYWREYLGPLGVVAAAIEQVTLRLPDHLVTPSRETATRLAGQGRSPRAFTVVPNGIDLDAIDAAEPATQSVDLLYVGRLLAHKHVDHLLAAIAILREPEGPREPGELHTGRSPDLSWSRTPGAHDTAPTCVIVGDGPERLALERDAARLGVGDSVRFLGSIAEESTVFGLMKAARVLVLPSVREGFGIVVAEAMACGLPVVTTRHPDNHAQALVEDGTTGWLCNPTAQSLAATLAVALRPAAGPATRSGVESAARRAAERFDWQSSVDGLLDLLETSCAGDLGRYAT